MLKKERQAFILNQVNLHNKVLSSTLSQQMNVSEDTIRRDLQDLANEGKVLKVHGGALSQSFSHVGYAPNHVYAYDSKKTIAQKAVTLIHDGMFVLTSGGTTIIELARSLPPQLKATFISGSVPAILEYMLHPAVDVILIGDKLSKNSKITIGIEAINQIKRIRAHYCFLGVNAINVEDGITDSDWDVVQLKKAMIESSQKVVCLTIAEKLNSLQPIHICEINKIDILITDLPPDDPALKPYRDAGIEVM
jgi:DeoR/GlpR family transcriptional regulator of sugar metabolism